MKHKVCHSCGKRKKITKFSKKLNLHQSACKKCVKLYDSSYRRSMSGLVTSIYKDQVNSSKQREHNKPNYSKEELKTWLFNQTLFHRLYEVWVSNEYKSLLRPSIDRLKDEMGYCFNNIQLVTWGENKLKASIDRKLGKSKITIPIKQLSLNGDFVNSFVSAREAQRITGILQGGISLCVKGDRKTAGGYKWQRS